MEEQIDILSKTFRSRTEIDNENLTDRLINNTYYTLLHELEDNLVNNKKGLSQETKDCLVGNILDIFFKHDIDATKRVFKSKSVEFNYRNAYDMLTSKKETKTVPSVDDFFAEQFDKSISFKDYIKEEKNPEYDFEKDLDNVFGFRTSNQYDYR